MLVISIRILIDLIKNLVNLTKILDSFIYYQNSN